MDSQNRIQNLSAVQTVPRQTPKKDFGDELANVVGTGTRLGLGIVGTAIGANPVVNAAVSTVTGAVSAVTGVSAQTVGRSSSASTAQTAFSGVTPVNVSEAGVARSASTGGDGGGAIDAISRQDAMSEKYLMLQMAMQQESREFNAVSNIIKVRHDSAKAAINNIR